MTTDWVLRPLDAAVAPVRARQHALLGEWLAWALAQGRPVDADVGAFVLGAVERPRDGEVQGVWTRPGVNDILQVGFTMYCFVERCLRPEGDVEAMWSFLQFLRATGRFDPRSDPLPNLLEPLRCGGGLDADGRVSDPPQPPDFPCQCFHDVVSPSRPGLSRATTADDVTIELWRPSQAEPVLASWYAPLARFSRLAREEGARWTVHLEDFEFVGRTDPSGKSPAVSMYRHERTGAELFLDDEGHPHLIRADARRRAGFRLAATSVMSAGWRAGLPEVAARPFVGRPAPYDDYDDVGDDDDGPVASSIMPIRGARRFT